MPATTTFQGGIHKLLAVILKPINRLNGIEIRGYYFLVEFCLDQLGQFTLKISKRLKKYDAESCGLSLES